MSLENRIEEPAGIFQIKTVAGQSVFTPYITSNIKGLDGIFVVDSLLTIRNYLKDKKEYEEKIKIFSGESKLNIEAKYENNEAEHNHFILTPERFTAIMLNLGENAKTIKYFGQIYTHKDNISAEEFDNIRNMIKEQGSERFLNIYDKNFVSKNRYDLEYSLYKENGGNLNKKINNKNLSKTLFQSLEFKDVESKMKEAKINVINRIIEFAPELCENAKLVEDLSLIKTKDYEDFGAEKHDKIVSVINDYTKQCNDIQKPFYDNYLIKGWDEVISKYGKFDLKREIRLFQDAKDTVENWAKKVLINCEKPKDAGIVFSELYDVKKAKDEGRSFVKGSADIHEMIKSILLNDKELMYKDIVTFVYVGRYSVGKTTSQLLAFCEEAPLNQNQTIQSDIKHDYMDEFVRM